MSLLSVRDAALRDAADLYRQPGPIVSLYLALDDMDDPRRIDGRWRNLRDQLVIAGAPEADLKALDEEVANAGRHPGPRVLAAFYGSGRLINSKLLEHSMAGDRVYFGPLPAGGPYYQWAQGRITYLVVVTDHTGADITVRVWPEQLRSVAHVEGSNDEITAHASGGWAALAMSRYERRVVDSWRHNAGEVAVAVAAAVDESNAEIVCLTGDLRSVGLLRKALPAHLQERVRVLDVGGTRGAAGVSPEAAPEVRKFVADRNATASTDVLQAWRNELGQGGAMTSGAQETVKALREGKVGTLLVGYDEASRQSAWIGAEPAQVAVGRNDLAPSDVIPLLAPLAEAAIRAALATRAAVHVLPPELADEIPDGLAGILRFS